MKVVNLRFLGVLLACLAVLATALCVVHALQTRRISHRFLEEAQRAKSEEDLEEAARRYRRYLQLEPHDADARAELGLLLIELDQFEPAFATLETALNEDPSKTDVRRRLVDLAIDMRLWSHAREHLEKHLLGAEPSDGELLELLAECQEAVEQYGPAAETLERAIESDPGRLGAYRRLADLLRERLDRAEEADRWMERLVSRHPGSAEAYRLRGDYRRSVGSTDEAAADAARAAEVAPDDPKVLLLAAQCASDQGRYDEASRLAERAVEADAQQAAAYSTLAEIEIGRGRREEAIGWLRRGVEALPEQNDLAWNLARFLLDAGRVGEAREIADRLRRRGHAQPTVAYLEARIAYQRAEWREARERFRYCRAELSGPSELTREIEYWLGESCGKLGNPDEQIAAYRKSVAADRFYLPARVALAEALASAGRMDEALAVHEDTMQLEGAPARGWLLLARWRMIHNRARKPTDRDWGRVEEALKRAAQATPNAAELVLLSADLLIAREQPDRAEELLEDACRKAPGVDALWAARAALAQRRGQWDRAGELLDEAGHEAGDTPLLRLARGHWLVGRDGSRDAGALEELAETPDGFTPDQAERLRRGLLGLALQTGDQELAVELCESLLDGRPSDLDVWLALLEIAVQSGDASRVQRALEAIRRVEGRGPTWHYAQAVRLMAQARDGRIEPLDQAESHLAEARLARPSWPRLAAAAGWIEEQRGNRAAAVEHYQRAVDLEERSPETIGRAVRLLYRDGRYREALELIERLPAGPGPLSAGFDRVQRDLRLRVDDLPGALQWARSLAEGSTDHRDHLWLGALLTVQAQRAAEDGQADGKADGKAAERRQMLLRAERSLKHALELAPEAPEVWVAWVQFLAAAGRAAEVEAAIRAAQSRIRADQADLALGQCCELIGKPDQAERFYQRALDAAPGDPGRVRRLAGFYLRTARAVKAEPLLRRLLSHEQRHQEGADAADILWARRTLAMVLAGRGGYPQLTRALELIEKNLASPGRSDRDRRTKAILLASHPARAQRAEAVAILAELVGQGRSPVPEDRFLLAQIHLASGDFVAYARQMRTLLASHSHEPRHVTHYVKALLDRSETAEAELWLERLEKTAPPGATITALKAEALFRRGRFEEAVELLTGWAGDDRAEPQDRADRVKSVAATLETFARRLEDTKQDDLSSRFAREAERLYRRHATAHPDEELLMATFLARQGRVEEALAVAEAAAADASPGQLAAATAELLRTVQREPEAVPRLEALLESSLKTRGRPAGLLLALAELRVVQQQSDEAESIYREILRGQPDHVTALNNLASLLALQQKHTEEALVLADKAIEIAGPLAGLLDTRAAVYTALGQPEKAMLDANAAIAEGPTPVRYFHRAQAAYLLGNRAAARDDLETARELGLERSPWHPLERRAYDRLQAALDRR